MPTTQPARAPVKTPAIQPAHLRDLLLAPHQHPRGQPHLSAASGLVRVGHWLYVVADDEHHLGVIEDGPRLAGEQNDSDLRADPPVTLLRLFEGRLPKDKGKRKAVKPDLETLVALPPLPGHPHGALLALGSGSRPTRETGVLLGLDARGAVLEGALQTIALQGIYAGLRAQFADLNIEGAFVSNARGGKGDAMFCLLQRGNKGDARNACIRFDWHDMARWLGGDHAAPPAAHSVQLIALGSIKGVPLGLTDGAALSGGGWVFSAVAENTGDSFTDGVCVGSALGVVAPDGSLRQLHRLKGKPKVEGIALQEERAGEGGALVITLVTDADDPTQASQMLRARLALL